MLSPGIKMNIVIIGKECMSVALQKLDEAARERLKKCVEENASRIHGEIRMGAPSGTGELKRSITIRRSTDRLSAGIKASRKQWAYAEWGMGPLGSMSSRDRPSWFKARSALSRMPYFGAGSKLAVWANKKGLNPYLVSKGIFHRQGFKGKPHWVPAINRNYDRVMAAIEAAIVGAVDDAAKAGQAASKGVA
jgi:hypothetical protein